MSTPEIFTKDQNGIIIKKGDKIKITAKPDDLTHLDVYSEQSKKTFLNGQDKVVDDIVISSGRGLVYIKEGAERVFFYADTVTKVKGIMDKIKG